MTPFDIVGIQPRPWSMLSKSFAAGRLSGSYLFHGPDGCGRWALGIALAALVNCESPVPVKDGMSLSPCCACRACRMIAALNSEVLLFAVPIPPHKSFDEVIESTASYLEEKRREPFALVSAAGATTIPIAIARDISRRLSLRPSPGMRRVVLFHQMERMLLASADALLKLIEEPPADTIIILTARRPDALLPTIQSRTRHVKVGRVNEDAAVNYLIEHRDAPRETATMALRLSNGSLGEAINILIAGETEASSQRAVGFLLYKSLLTESSPRTIAHLVDLVPPRNRGLAEDLLKLWQSLTRDCAHLAATGDASRLTNVDFAADIERLAGMFANTRLTVGLSEGIKIALADLRRNVHILGALTALVLNTKALVADRGDSRMTA